MARDFRPQLTLCNLGVPGFEAVIAADSGYGNDNERRKNETDFDRHPGYGNDNERRKNETDFDRHPVKPISRAALEELCDQAVTLIGDSSPSLRLSNPHRRMIAFHQPVLRVTVGIFAKF